MFASARDALRHYRMGRLYGIPRCCRAHFAFGTLVDTDPSAHRLAWGAATNGRVPCVLCAWRLGKPPEDLDMTDGLDPERVVAALARMRDIARMAHENGADDRTRAFLGETMAEYADAFAEVDAYEASFRQDGVA